MSYNLFLDDFRYPQTAFSYTRDPRHNKLNWTIVRSYDEFVATVEKQGIPDIISYDHDLADEHYAPETWNPEGEESYLEKTGLHCARYLLEKLDGTKHPEYIIHSMNPVGSRNIQNAIEDYDRYRRG